MGTFNSKSIFQFASKSDIIKLILVVTILFVLLQFIRISMLLNSNDDTSFYTYLWNKLCIPTSGKVFIRQPWSVLTYFFIDDSFMRIVGNMIWLWIFGSVIEDLKGSDRVLPVFITGGIVGGIFMLLFSLIKQSPLQLYDGATTCVMAVAFAALRFKPQYKFWWFLGIGIPIWVFVLIFMAFQLASIQLTNLPYLFLLLGGVMVGLMYTNVLFTYFEKFTALLKRSSDVLDNRNFVLKKEQPVRFKTIETMPFKRVQFTPAKIDELLDKINEKGIDSLTKEERRLLDDYSDSKK